MTNDAHIAQIKVYTERIEHWEAQLRLNTYLPGEYGITTNFIKKHYELIDTLLDKMIENNSKILCTALDK